MSESNLIHFQTIFNFKNYNIMFEIIWQLRSKMIHIVYTNRLTALIFSFSLKKKLK